MHSNVYFLPRTPPITYGIPAVAARLLYKVIGLADLSFYSAVHVVNKAIRVKHLRVFYVPLFVDTNTYRPLAENEINLRCYLLEGLHGRKAEISSSR